MMAWLRCFAGVVLSAALPAAAQDRAPLSGAQSAVRMTATEIADYNAALAPTDPGFIKCVRMENPGSMVKRRVCRTNADWNQRADTASQEARDIVDRIQLHGSSYPEEPPGSLVPLTPN